MSVIMSVIVNVNVNASARGLLLRACVARRCWQVDPSSGWQSGRGREGGGAHKSSGATGDAVRVSGRVE